jgi:hypothetical protein
MFASAAGWQKLPVPPGLAGLYPPAARVGPRAYWHPRRRLSAFLTYDEIARGDMRWHISLRYGEEGLDGRIPTWEELVIACHDLRPGVPFALGIPPRSWWLNVHPHVLHLWELADGPLIAQWRAERQADRPT